MQLRLQVLLDLPCVPAVSRTHERGHSMMRILLVVAAVVQPVIQHALASHQCRLARDNRMYAVKMCTFRSLIKYLPAKLVKGIRAAFRTFQISVNHSIHHMLMLATVHLTLLQDQVTGKLITDVRSAHSLTSVGLRQCKQGCEAWRRWRIPC